MPEHMWECQDGKEEEFGGEEEIYVLLWEQLKSIKKCKLDHPYQIYNLVIEIEQIWMKIVFLNGINLNTI